MLIGFQHFSLLPEESLHIEMRIDAAVEWILTAASATKQGGISKGYSLMRGRWAPSYPETTGYSIPTLLNVARIFNRPELFRFAISLADYLLECRTPEGGVAHFQTKLKSKPVVFDTGQVIFGWLAAYSASEESVYLEAASQAGDWLVQVQHPSGLWREFQHLYLEKVIDTRVAWALLELYQVTHQDAYRKAAIRNLEWAIKRQDPDGWFNECSLVRSEDPLTHTLAYTAEGFLECGRLLNEPRYLASAQLTANALFGQQKPDGSLASTYASGWRETSSSSCLTGNCQVAHLWLRLHSLFSDSSYLTSAMKALRFVAQTQNLATSNRNIRGGIAGSFPIFGRYERLKYPNWAAKFYIDAMLALSEQTLPANTRYYVG